MAGELSWQYRLLLDTPVSDSILFQYIMRNDSQPRIRKIISLVKKLPYFSLENLRGIESNKTYLRILFSRYRQMGKLTRLKKGLYTTQEYLEGTQKMHLYSSYLEFLANILTSPSYLSLDYVLYQHHLLSELPINFTSITNRKTIAYSNSLGNFFYHKIKEGLFCGFEIIEEGDFRILKATKAKALFDFLYLRKNLLMDKSAAEELRLNLNNFGKDDFGEFKKYLQMADLKRMREIAHFLF